MVWSWWAMVILDLLSVSFPFHAYHIEGISLIIFNLNVGIIVALVYATMKDKNFFDLFVFPQAWSHFGFMALVAVFSMVGQTLLVLALQYENAGPVSLLRTCDIIFNFVLQYFINNQEPDIWRYTCIFYFINGPILNVYFFGFSSSLIGASIVISASLIFGFRKYIQLLPAGDPKKERYKCFLL